MANTMMSPAERFARMFDRSFARDWGLTPPYDEASTRSWVPAVDIEETTEALVVHADVPGLKKEDINITVENNLLTLSGERKFEKETKGQDWHRVERSYGSFSRSFSLPNNVQTDKVDASFKDGVLSVHIPKSEAARPRRIAIK